jgi:hypothetical protein
VTMADEHTRLFEVAVRKPEDYEPYGDAERTSLDCSGGCRFARRLAGGLGADWVVCTNPASHRAGLLTFEHQGCARFEPEASPSEGAAVG